MKLTKKLTAITLAAVMSLSLAVGCSSAPADSTGSSAAPSSGETSSTPVEKATIRVGALKGPTGLGMLKLMDDSDKGAAANDYEFTIVASPDDMVAKVSSGEVDCAAVPPNLAATLYQKTEGKIQLANINTLGILSILTNGMEVNSIEDLKGKTIYSTGQGAVPEYALNYILEKNGLEVGKDITVEYKSEHSELATLMISGEVQLAVLPEPFVTQVTAKNADVKIAMNLTDEWDKATNKESVLCMGGLIVNKEFAEKNKDAFNQFLDEYKASVEYVNSNPADAAKISEEKDIMAAAVAEKAIPNCNIVYIDGSEMKEKVSGFLKVLYDANAKSVGGSLPDEDFYYTK